jgi:hypothetical protein
MFLNKAWKNIFFCEKLYEMFRVKLGKNRRFFH